jgi:type IV pilus assembly protein PilW
MTMIQQRSSRHQAGFSLIEILVGLVIGLLATLVIMQVFSVFEGQKRSTTGSADAQTNGSIALYSIEHELRMAGYGLLPATDSPLICTTLSFDTTGMTSISPVTITDGGAGAGASDSITIRYGTSDSGGVPSVIMGVGVTGANDITLNDNMGCHVGDVALIINGATCNFTNVTGPTDIAIPPVASAPPNTQTVTLNNIAGAINDANLACMGSLVTTVFRVNPNYDPTDPANSQAYLEKDGNPSISDIVNIQAQYGISATAGSNQITNWVDAVAPWDEVSLQANIANRNRIKAIRVAVVARNGLLEKNDVTNACSSTTAASPTGLCSWDATSAAPPGSAPGTNFPAPVIDLSNDPSWQQYRYRVFETIIPLRNMIWASSTL